MRINQVFINICVQQVSFWGRKHPLSRFLHNFMVPYLLTEAHSGYDLPYDPFNRGVFHGGSRRHDFHHSHGGGPDGVGTTGCYGSLFPFWDWLCGTDRSYHEWRRKRL